MSALSFLIGIAALVGSLFTPATAVAALGTAFGGQLITPPVPCTFPPPLIGSFLVTVRPIGGINIHYVYTPILSVGTLPPVHPGQYILGVADTPTGCNGIPTAQRIQIFGVSI